YLHSARGVDCGPDQIIIGAGNDYLLMLLWVILGKNRRMAMESPTYLSAYYDLLHMGCQILPVGQDEQGIRIEELEKTEADTVYVMPSHQFPMGMVMPLKRRMELLKWAGAREGRYIIEDDYDSEFRYKGQPIPALSGFDQKGCVIYLGTFSKSLAPSVRVSYMVLPRELMKAYLSLEHLFSVTVSRTDQKILELFLREGYYERHLNRMRAVYKNKHDLMVNYLKDMSHICTFSGENAGVHLLVKFCNGLTEEEAVFRAKEAGIKVYGVSEYRIQKLEKEENMVLLGYATMKEEDIEMAMKILKEIWNH
ncbi:MAG TPA: PLP-dependent aminotransferase family protein, partial [Candidatus Blautia merdigallinarum]|nr:PLP-dependent aminotransferase family protein [Candidatus Blautia merdigallinarum]